MKDYVNFTMKDYAAKIVYNLKKIRTEFDFLQLKTDKDKKEYIMNSMNKTFPEVSSGSSTWRDRCLKAECWLSPKGQLQARWEKRHNVLESLKAIKDKKYNHIDAFVSEVYKISRVSVKLKGHAYFKLKGKPGETDIDKLLMALSDTKIGPKGADIICNQLLSQLLVTPQPAIMKTTKPQATSIKGVAVTEVKAPHICKCSTKKKEKPKKDPKLKKKSSKVYEYLKLKSKEQKGLTIEEVQLLNFFMEE
jgi:hypothetical protein